MGKLLIGFLFEINQHPIICKCQFSRMTLPSVYRKHMHPSAVERMGQHHGPISCKASTPQWEHAQ